MIERVSIEVSRRCSKRCEFCYSASEPDGGTQWTADDLVGFATDLAANGVRSVSFGGGEPLELDGMLEVLERLRGVIARSLTTNGLPLLDPRLFAALVATKPEKVHVSIHFPDRDAEVERVIATVQALEAAGVPSGVNLLVSQATREPAAQAGARLRLAGIGNDRIVYLPLRGGALESPGAVLDAAGRTHFQSMTCLAGCARSDRFCSIGWDRSIAWCSYTRSRRVLRAPTFAALAEALEGLGLEFCGSGSRGRLPVASDAAEAAAPAVVRHARTDGVAAAHSMDTEWWAVDHDGHLAAFDSSEAGAVPLVAAGLSDAGGNYVDELAERGPRGEEFLDPAGYFFSVYAGRDSHVPNPAMSVSIVFFLKSLDLLEESLAKGRFRRMKSTSGYAVVSRDITQKEADEIHARGQCLGCFHYYEWRDRITLAQMGIFRYDHVDSCENWISGPYARRSVPSDPILVDEVPAGLRRLAYRVRFADLCFRDREFIQPVEEFPCVSHQRAYVELNGRFARPMPGDELTYHESYAERVRASVPEEMREDEDLIWLPAKDEWLRRG